MLDRTGKPTPRLQASVLREELEGRLQRLQELEHWIKESAGADSRERARRVVPRIARARAMERPSAVNKSVTSCSPGNARFGDRAGPLLCAMRRAATARGTRPAH